MAIMTDLLGNDTDCARARQWADYFRRVAKTAVTAGLIIVLAAAAMVLLALWLLAVNRGGQALASGGGAVVTGVLSTFVFTKAKEYKREAEAAETRARNICGSSS